MSEQLMILYKSSSLDRYIMSLELPHTFKRVVKCGSVKVEAFVSQYNYLVEEVDRVKTLIDELNSAIDNSENWLIISWYQSKRNFARYYLESLESDLSAAHMTLHLHKLGFSN